ncbi:MAG: type II toxin-antitoxin system RelE/ParE family toxin [Syntrophales bacterium]|nr:type II toxin-antitoxin system RelE/ParE family toxin [Syntrophales bacterium]
MKLLLLAHGRYQVFAACSDRGDCQLLSFLNALEGDRQDQADRLINLLDRAAREGPPRNTDICHQIKGDIWQFESGKLRVLWFYGRGRGVVVCSHGFPKETKRTRRRDIKQAERTHRKYFDDVARGDIEIFESVDEE